MIETTHGTQKALYLHVVALASSVFRTKETSENNVMEMSILRKTQQSVLITADNIILHQSPKKR
jgi:hypothetical protein